MYQLKEIFKALADETRLRILKLLQEGEVCVCELMEVLGMPQSTVSRHMSVLRRAGLVQGRREGKWVHYRLEPSFNPHAPKVIGLIKELLEDDPIVKGDREALRKVKERGLCDDGGGGR